MRITFKCGHSFRQRGPRNRTEESKELCYRCQGDRLRVPAAELKTKTTTFEYWDDDAEEVWDETEDEALWEHKTKADKELSKDD